MPRNVQSESNFMPARASPSDFAVPYNFSISFTCGFAFGHGVQERVFMWYTVLHIEGLRIENLSNFEVQHIV